MSSHRGRQKSLEKKKNKRVVAARNAARSSLSSSRSATLKLAASSPFGPAFMSGAWRSEDELAPGLVSVIFTRVLPDRTFLVESCLVDRTCLGVKDAFVKGPLTPAELDAFVARYEDVHAEGIEEVSVLEALSVVFHALDYAKLLGFTPHHDFSAELLGPRPETLIDTPLAHPSEPHYLPGPHDDVVRITRVLQKHSGDRALARGEMGVEALLNHAVGDEATLCLDAELEQSIFVALAASDDFLRSAGGFEMLGTPRGKKVVDAESLASIQPVKPGEWRVVANSTARYERILARLGALGGRSVEVSKLEVIRPWEVQPGLAAEESPETTRLVRATARLDAPTERAAKAAARDMMLDAPLQAIDADVPAVGGKPRDVVSTPDGRARVEAWLEAWELKGMPSPDGWSFLDLDPVRRELGLPPIVESATRQPRGRPGPA